MRKLLAVGITAFALLQVAVPAAAQDEGSNRSGFWLNVGLGYGSAKASCSSCDSQGALAGNLALGFTLSPKLLLGVESDGWMHSESGFDEQIGNLSGAVYFYPMTSPFFLKGGVGMGWYRVSGNGFDDTESGFGFMAGAGYDFDLGSGKYAISPYAMYRYADLSNLNETIGVFQFGASFTLH